jgi:5'-deoxynucleotidase YfbR-like HD superfamily hydrolase
MDERVKALSFDDVFAASGTTRYHMLPTIRPQNLAEHSFRVAGIAVKLWYLIVEEVVKVNPNYAPMAFIDSVELAIWRYAFWHDMEEIRFGDIPGHVKFNLKLDTDVIDRMFWTESRGVNLETSKPAALVKYIVKIADLAEGYVFGVGNVGKGPNDSSKTKMDCLHSWIEKLDSHISKCEDSDIARVLPKIRQLIVVNRLDVQQMFM